MTDYNLKIMLAGPGAVGKTACRIVFTDRKYAENCMMTIGVDISFGEVEGSDYLARLNFWDLAGQDRFGIVRQHYYKGVHGLVLMFDLTRPHSLDDAWKFFNDEVVPCTAQSPLACIAVVGNKKDLSDKIVISDDDIADFLNKLKATLQVKYLSFKTSAKEMTGVDEMFNSLTECIVASLRSS